MPDDTMYYFSRFKSGEVVFASVFRCSLMWALRILRLMPGLCTLLYGKWVGRIEDYSKIIVFDYAALYAPTLLEDISRRTDTRELYLYSWNVNLSKEGIAKLIVDAKKTGFSLFSYDEQFCSRNNFRFNTIMYDPSICASQDKFISDVYFLGKAKDRIDAVEKAKALFDEAGLSTDFTVVANASEKVDVPGAKLVNGYISYEENIKKLGQSRAVLDVAQVGQVGYSMRVMESIFLERKLITTNSHVEDSAFFQYGNVLILTRSTTSDEIRNFIDRPFVRYGQEIRDYYSIERWVERFCPGNESSGMGEG
ncbi:hypothetical protein ACULPM_08250 [Thermophilibacter sp. ZX-H3]